MSAYKVSVIIVYNNKEKLDEAIQWLSKQTIAAETEMVLLDNREAQFSSAAKALNYGASISHSDVLVFMHQDMYLWECDFLEKYYKFLSQDNAYNTIAGVAGVCKSDNSIAGDIFEGKDAKIKRLKPTNGEICDAFTLDECLFSMRRKLWEDIKFDEMTCDNWHFYAGDICYSNLLNGGKNVVISGGICHDSLGHANPHDFNKTAKKMIKKYHGKIKRIDTTCFHCKCDLISFYFWVLHRRAYLLRLKLLGR